MSDQPPGPQTLAIPLSLRLLSDQLTPVLAYRRLVSADERTAPSFLLESVEGGEHLGRYSILSTHPAIEVIAHAHQVEVLTHRPIGAASPTVGRTTQQSPNPLLVPRELSRSIRLCVPGDDWLTAGALPDCPLGGWFGYASYDTVRYAEPEKLGFDQAPEDDRHLPDLHFGLYDSIVAFDHVAKLVYLVELAMVGPDDEPHAVYDAAIERLNARAEAIQTHSKPLPAGMVSDPKPVTAMPSNLSCEQHAGMVAKALEYIRAGDIFQVVIGQRFQRLSTVDPFDVYRALRAVNPSPYMVYMQCSGCMLVASSPEILCRVRKQDDGSLKITNRPLAGTRKRGRSEEEDMALEAELLADEKERAEHTMLVDLGRNDVGKVSRSGTVELPALMTIERYSHVMHISSTVTGILREGLDAWDALVATLPVGTISGAPKIRAMQIIDELEPIRRGPYGGGMGYVSLDGDMDIALALRTIVVPTRGHEAPQASALPWTYHIQAAGGIVADSRARAEYDETVNKAAALGRAIDLAEDAFGS